MTDVLKLIGRLKFIRDYECKTKAESEAVNDAITMLSTPERKKGKWNTYYHGDSNFSYSCNQCGYSAPYQMIKGEVFQKEWNFCPNCGADMGGDSE